jgi:hypothetical protein
MNSEPNDDRGHECDCEFPCFDVASGVLMRRNELTLDEAGATLWRFAALQDISMHALTQVVVNSAADRRPVRIR